MSEPMTDKQLKETGRRLRVQWMINTAAAGELLEEVYRLRAQHKWIKTSERLPEAGVEVWIVTIAKPGQLRWKGIGRLFRENARLKWFMPDLRAPNGDMPFELDEVSHWMPLYTPDLPEEVK